MGTALPPAQVPFVHLGVCLPVKHRVAALGQNESLELMCWLFTVDRRNPALFSWSGACVGGKRSIQWTNVVLHRVDVFLLCFFPSADSIN